MITQELVNHLFEYEDGDLIRKVDAANNAKAGDKVGTYSDGYLLTSINNRLWGNHRIIFVMHHGYLPKYIDHIDGDGTNNRIENLRECTNAENGKNRKINKNNKSGIKGVCWHKRQKKWSGEIRNEGKKYHLGYFKYIENCALAVRIKRRQLHGEFANHG